MTTDAINGRPGAAYLEIGGDTLREMVPAGTYFPPMTPDPPMQEAASGDIKAAIALLKTAKAPLVIVGKGAACTYPKFTRVYPNLP